MRAAEPSVRDLPATLAEVAALAHDMARTPSVSASFARAGRHASINPAVRGDHARRSKAEVFVGDLLWAAGLAPPIHRGSYARAALWPGRLDLFARVRELALVRPGDLIVVAWRDPRRDAHVEVVVETARRLALASAGARAAGLVADDRFGRMLVAAWPRDQRFVHDGVGREAELFVLRARLGK